MISGYHQQDNLILADAIEKELGIEVKVNEPMNAHTSFRVGGPADLYIEPTSRAELMACVAFLKQAQVEYRVIGNGTNLLVSDEGFRGAIIRLGPRLANWSREGNRILAEAGIALPVMAKRAANEGLSGLEFTSGIPGTLGGAIHMNAGAWGSTVGELVTKVWILAGEKEKELEKKDLHFSYRQSNLGSNIILAAELALTDASQDQIHELMQDYLKRRQESQPLGLPSAGSVFRNPPGQKAARIIDQLGLKGLSIGGAQVSTVHANFIVNTGYATASDIYRLIEEVKSIVYREAGVELKTEIEMIGFPTLEKSG
ncbi:MAG: UDP-N-acetylmuramate dehydrogenase [Firmicutes bacterium]|nr:UDP-N-acetylmuramate dehydrogenase [Bacillota bacterium]